MRNVELAIESLRLANANPLIHHEEVVLRAEAFYEFLTGSDDTKKKLDAVRAAIT